MFTFFYRIFEMFRTEKRRCAVDQNVDSAINHFFVSIQSHKTFIGRHIHALFRFQFIGKAIYFILEHIAQGNYGNPVGGIQEIHGGARSPSATAYYAGFQFFPVGSQIHQLGYIIGPGFFQRDYRIFFLTATRG
ncbi:hypothetical protein SDC9_201709 [bioreactor metagenome]|uniref:Uncharacterized protein n=1 Tax=bioreactor metagenome TaxID=1076179 RepID=A0A645ISW4_9ZZZZ